MNPKISIIMGTYNRATLIQKTVESVQAQTITDFELIIADDGSSDDTEGAVGKLIERDPRVIFVKNVVNQGISKNYNTALTRARGEYLAMIDDDDPWIDTHKLEKQIAFLEKNPEYVGCGGGAVVVDGAGKEKYRYLKPETDTQIRKYMLFSNPMANSTTVFRRSAAQKVHFYDSSIRYAGDRDFWLKMGLVGKLYNFPEYFSYYTMNGNNTSITKIRPHLKTSLAVMKRYKGKYPHYFLALLLNKLQYAYAFLPLWFRKLIHGFLAQGKRFFVK